MTPEQVSLIAELIDIKVRAAEHRMMAKNGAFSGHSHQAIKLEKEANEIIEKLTNPIDDIMDNDTGRLTDIEMFNLREDQDS